MRVPSTSDSAARRSRATKGRDVEESVAAGRGVVGQQAVDRVSQLRVVGAHLDEQGLAIRRWAPEGRGEDGAHLSPALGGHGRLTPVEARSRDDRHVRSLAILAGWLRCVWAIFAYHCRFE